MGPADHSRQLQDLHLEHALSQAEEKYRAIFEDAVIGIFQITPEGRPVSINRALPTPFTCRCTSEATTNSAAVWGTDVYTDDSSICRAALHAGVITPSGGTVTMTRGDGLPLYVGSTRNGVMSNDFGSYPVSITFSR